MRIVYVPLEPYKERYTCQLSAPIIGWLESRWIENSVPYIRIEGQSLNKEIKTGSVLDACGRGYWCNSQIMKILRLLNNQEINSNDCIYFDDFWHPGIEALSYAFHLTGIKPKMFAMLHAQSIDIFDFTYPMRYWMRYFEKGIGKILDGIFVTSTCLKDLCLYHNVGNENNVFLCGLPYNSNEVLSHLSKREIDEAFQYRKENKQVIFTSRWDKEKCPNFFLETIHMVMRERKDIKFVITTSARELRSNDPILLHCLNNYLNKYPENIVLKVNLTKEGYYKELVKSRIQINTSDQDFVSWTLLEATTWGCRPLYPYFLSFPEVLPNDFMYRKNDLFSAALEIVTHIDQVPNLKDFDWVYHQFDWSWKRMLDVMQTGIMEYPLYA